MSKRDIIDVGSQGASGGGALRFTVPGPVRGKGRPRFFVRKGGDAGAKPSVGTFTDHKTASYENLIKLAARQAGARQIEGAVEVIATIEIQIPKSASKAKRAAMLSGQEPCTRKPDIDNVVKALMDGLNGVAFADDVQVVRCGVAKRWAASPSLTCIVRPA